MKRLSRAAAADLQTVLGGAPLDERQARFLVEAAVAFADPYLGVIPDSLLPADRPLLRREFFRQALQIDAATNAQLVCIARGLAPAPGAHDASHTFRVGRHSPTYNQALQAFRWRRNNRTRRITAQAAQ